MFDSFTNLYSATLLDMIWERPNSHQFQPIYFLSVLPKNTLWLIFWRFVSLTLRLRYVTMLVLIITVSVRWSIWQRKYGCVESGNWANKMFFAFISYTCAGANSICYDNKAIVVIIESKFLWSRDTSTRHAYTRFRHIYITVIFKQ